MEVSYDYGEIIGAWGLRRNGTENLHKEFPRAKIGRFPGSWERQESWGVLTVRNR